MILTEHERQFAEPAITIIKQRWPDLWKNMSVIGPNAPIQLSQTEPYPAFSLEGIQLASSYAPEEEAKLQIGSIDGDASEVWLYGVGMGYLPRQLLEDRKKLEKLHIYIFNVSLFYSLLHWIDQSDWLSDARTELYIPDADTLPIRPYAVTTPCLWLADEASFPLRDRLQSEINAGFIQEDWKKKERRLQQQLQENVEFIEHDGDVTDLYPERNVGERDVIVAGAGPTLETAMENIRAKQQSGAMLVAVDAALKPLVNNGIVPDVIVSIDPEKAGVLPNFTGDLSALAHTVLVYCPVVHHDVLSRWPHRRVVAYPESDPLYDDLRKAHPRGQLFVNGSVIHPAIDLAHKLGATTVYLTGADFAFPHNRTHASAVPHGAHMPEGEGEIKGLTIKDGNGNLIPSKINMVGYLRDVELYIQNHRQTRFVNLSREGAYIAGTSYED